MPVVFRACSTVMLSKESKKKDDYDTFLRKFVRKKIGKSLLHCKSKHFQTSSAVTLSRFNADIARGMHGQDMCIRTDAHFCTKGRMGFFHKVGAATHLFGNSFGGMERRSAICMKEVTYFV